MQADIVIVGAGMVGSLLAAALKHLPLKIVMIDNQQVTEPNNSELYEPRVSALTRASENMLKALGAWSLINTKRSAPFTSMMVREQQGHGELYFHADDLGISHLGCLIENRLLQWALTEQAVASPQVTLLVPDKVVALEKGINSWFVSLASGSKIETQLVVGADGAFSAVRQLVGIEVDTWDYQQHAIVCSVNTEHPHQDCARQNFLATGPLAFLPLSDPHYCSIVWSAQQSEAQRLMSLNDEAFLQALERAFPCDLGRMLSCDQRYSFPLVARHAQRYCLEGLVLIGDAAHTIHPLAGQGVNLGLLDAAILAEEIELALKKSLAIGHLQVLSKYSRRRRAHNALTMHSMTALERTYAATSTTMIMARNEGVRFVNKTAWLKEFFEKQAMGLVGDLPQLAK